LAKPSANSDLALLPLGALMLAVSVSGWSQTITPAPSVGTNTSTAAKPAASGNTLAPVTVTEKAIVSEGKDTLRATQSTIGKGNQQLRDIPQSVTVVTEKLINDRNLDTVKEALKNTAGVTFLAAEGGEEDIRLRGFALQSTGDIFIDGMRDPAFYDRDTFALDRLEVLRGSASMLFGRGSTGGAVNQVTKQPRLIDEHEVSTTLGSHNYKRVVGDFNLKTGEDAALRINTMVTKADNNGAGTRLDKNGIAIAYRHGIGTTDEVSASLYYLNNNNGINYGIPYIKPRTGTAATVPASSSGLSPFDPTAYYGYASDRNDGNATIATAGHVHRFSADTELKTQIRFGKYERDQRASLIRYAGLGGGVSVGLDQLNPNTVLTRGRQNKVQTMDTIHAQSDLSTKFEAFGFKHELLTGVDFAQEKKTVYTARNAAQGGFVPAAPNTTVGTPNDGVSIDENNRTFREGNNFSSRAVGIYAQELLQIRPHWKLLAGLRYDRMIGHYSNMTIPPALPGPITTTPFSQNISEFSHRLGVLYQPNELQSYHFSYGTSFNTSGDTYSYSANNVNTDPESSRNFEVGAKLDTADKMFTTRLAIFHSTKYHERNTDPTVNLDLLSGKRHVAGFEMDLTGRLTPQWEVYGSYMWMPSARIDIGVPGSEGEGSRPSLTPRNSGTIWSTYQLTPAVRVGAGVNFRGKQTPNRNPGFEVGKYATLDLLAEYVINDRFTLKANLTNATNKLYGDALYTAHYIPGAGRLFQVTGIVKF
jgi:catecholate siderophore receptor